MLRSIQRHSLSNHDSLHAEELRDLLAGADAYLSPYSAEGFNLPALEAVAVGTPAIVTAGGPTDEYLPDEVASKVLARQV